MNKIVNKFLLAGDKFVPKMHLRQPGFTYRACGPFTKNKEGIQKFKETGDSRYIYQSKLNKACFQYELASEDFKYLTRSSLNLAHVAKVSDCRVSDRTRELAEEFNKPIIRKINERKVQ